MSDGNGVVGDVHGKAHSVTSIGNKTPPRASAAQNSAKADRDIAQRCSKCDAYHSKKAGCVKC